MFHEALLESAPLGRRRKRWPMAAAVTLEAIVCGALVVLPLLSGGIIHVAAPPPEFFPLEKPQHRVPTRPPEPREGGVRGVALQPGIVSVATGRTTLCFHCTSVIGEGPVTPDMNVSVGRRDLPDGLANCSTCKHAGPGRGPVPVSNLAPGSLIYRLEPVYPRMAIVTHARGLVRLHAIIATDGTIQSLSVIDGSPLLADAAREAVRQWRYRPYVLNGQPVEVETIITVNFKGAD